MKRGKSKQNLECVKTVAFTLKWLSNSIIHVVEYYVE